MTRVGRYEIKDKLGEGSMGVIYRAQDTVLEREVALKTLSTAGVNETELLERFYREARACARLRHPNIITVFDFGEENQVAFIAMELLEGADLRTVIADRRPLSLEEKLTLMAAVCDGLHHAHGKAIIHRDVKPSNIFLGSDGQPRILDFGVARMPSSSLTTSGRVLGTPHYMAPEQLTGKPCDHRSDIFSAAIVTFELIAGTHPFHGSSHGSRMRRIVEGSPESLLAVNPGLPAELEQALARALAKNPEERFPTAAAFAEALREQIAVARQVSIDPWPATATFQQAVHGTETMMAELLDCLQKFDDAAEQGDVSTARAAFDVMKKVGGGDSRFAVALEQSEKRMAELEAAAGIVTAAEAPPAERAAEAAPAAEPEMAAAKATAPGDATMFFERPAVELPVEAAAPAPVTPVTLEPPAAVKKVEPPEPRVIPIRPAAAVPEPPRRNLMAWAALGLAVVAAAIVAGVWLARSPVERKPPVAMAEVASEKAELRARPEESAATVATVKRGVRLGVVRAPRFREQAWTEVQFAGGNPAASALYIRTADLTNWTSQNRELASQLNQLFAPEPAAPGTPAAASAAAPESSAPAAPVAAPALTDVKLNADFEIRAATNLWQAGDYDGASRVLQRLLKAQPGLPAALQLLGKVQKAKEVEGR